jgi:hypothetical protein
MYPCRKKGWLFYVNALANSIKCGGLFIAQPHRRAASGPVPGKGGFLGPSRTAIKYNSGGYLGWRHTPCQIYIYSLSTGKLVHDLREYTWLKNALKTSILLKNKENKFSRFRLLCVDNSPVQRYDAPLVQRTARANKNRYR